MVPDNSDVTKPDFVVRGSCYVLVFSSVSRRVVVSWLARDQNDVDVGRRPSSSRGRDERTTVECFLLLTCHRLSLWTGRRRRSSSWCPSSSSCL